MNEPKQIKYAMGMIVEINEWRVQLVQFKSETKTHEQWLVSPFDGPGTFIRDLPKYKEE